MRELFETFLDRQPRIPLGINSAGGSGLRHFFGGVSAGCYRSEPAQKSNQSDCNNSAPGASKLSVFSRPQCKNVHNRVLFLLRSYFMSRSSIRSEERRV